MSVHARITATAPALRNGVRPATGPRAGRVDCGNRSSEGCSPQTLYSSAKFRVFTGQSTSATLPCRFSSDTFGLLPAYTISPVTPAALVSPEYGKYDVTRGLNAPSADPAIAVTTISQRRAFHRGNV